MPAPVSRLPPEVNSWSVHEEHEGVALMPASAQA